MVIDWDTGLVEQAMLGTKRSDRREGEIERGRSEVVQDGERRRTRREISGKSSGRGKHGKLFDIIHSFIYSSRMLIVYGVCSQLL